MLIKNKYATLVVHKVISKAYIVVQEWTEPDAPSANGILASTLLLSSAQTIAAADITDPDFPRVLEIDSDEGAATGNVVITGTNIRGETIVDTIALNGTTAVSGVKAFKTIASILLPAKAATESVWVGWLDKLGLQSIPISTEVISEDSGNAASAGGTLLTRNATSIERCVYDPSTEADGSTDKAVAYISSELPTRVGGYTE